MINPLIEEMIPFAEASKLFPKRRRGQRPSISCLYRWTTCGCRGVVLESVQAGGTRCTTREAVQRFVERLTNNGPAAAAVTSPRQPPSPRNKATAQASAYLDREGV